MMVLFIVSIVARTIVKWERRVTKNVQMLNDRDHWMIRTTSRRSSMQMTIA